jgi:transaldolase
MIDPNAVRRLKATNPQLEIWWDSSPLVYADWTRGPGRPFADAGLFALDTTDAGGPSFSPSSVLDGATTNQPLTWQVLDKYPQEWGAWLAARPRLNERDAMWRVFIEVAARGAAMLDPIFQATDHCRGQICCQVDPRDLEDLPAMVEQARRIHAARPNIMIKLPGTREGIEAVRILTAEGVPTNVTLGFTVSQLMAVGEAAQLGLAEARQRGTDLRNWRSCAVMMLGRYEDAPPLKAQAAELGVSLSEADIRWAGIAIFRKTHALYAQRGYPSKLMAASMRVGPIVDGVTRVWHLEKLAGACAVLTVFPNIFEAFLGAYAGLPIESQIDEPVPGDVLERLLRIPYFAEAYDEHGLAPDQWVHHPALVATATSFTEAMVNVQAFAARSLSK